MKIMAGDLFYDDISMYQFMFSRNVSNNGALSGQKAMPQKDFTSDNQSSFEMSRRTYVETLPSVKNTVSQTLQKKWYGNRDASQIVANRRTNQVGIGSLNASRGLMSFTTYKEVNTVNDALTRVRAGGAVSPAKKGANMKNGLTPSFSPQVNLINKTAFGNKQPFMGH